MNHDVCDISLPRDPKIIVARTDRIGDLALTIPLFASLRAHYPNGSIAALTRDYTRDIALSRPDLIDEVISFEAPTSHVPYRLFGKLTCELKTRRFDLAIIAFSNFTVAALIAISKIPIRIGPASKLAQIFLTHRIRQNRSESDRGESEYNLELLGPLGIEPCRDFQLKTDRKLDPRKLFPDYENGDLLIGIAPNCGGSALNWPPERYGELIDLLASGKWRESKIVLIGAPTDEDAIDRALGKSLRHASARLAKYITDGSIRDLLGALQSLSILIAPSTGPLHLASALGIKTVGLYSDIKTQSPKRWGPLGANSRVLTPNSVAGKSSTDAPTDPMMLITATDVADALALLIDA